MTVCEHLLCQEEMESLCASGEDFLLLTLLSIAGLTYFCLTEATLEKLSQSAQRTLIWSTV
ncbi:hypothetical protein ACRRTK_004197 [Alexandromys fortis]